LKRFEAKCCVDATGGVAQKCLITDGRVSVAGCGVIEERLEPDSGVARVASGVQRPVTHTRLLDSKLKHPNSSRPLWPGWALRPLRPGSPCGPCGPCGPGEPAGPGGPAGPCGPCGP